MYRVAALIVVLTCTTVVTLGQLASYEQLLQHHNQVIYVTTASANAITGTMRLFERRNTGSNWSMVDSFPVTVGRSGLARDPSMALPETATLPMKQEGDGKSPAGLFDLGPVFSYHALNGIRMPFKQVGAADLCIDDSRSVHYNRLVDADTIAQRDWNSFEYMRRQDAQYEYGVWVLYNSSDYTPGNGSCIFLHVWADDSTPTSGCTAMQKDRMLRLINWLDAGKRPVLLQVVPAPH